jgi:hypothetical protein
MIQLISLLYFPVHYSYQDLGGFYNFQLWLLRYHSVLSQYHHHLQHSQCSTWADTLPYWCKCSICHKSGPQGLIKSQQTARKHSEDDNRTLGLPRGTTWNHGGSSTPITNHNLEDDSGQSTGFGELFSGVGSDSSQEDAAERGSDGWMDEWGGLMAAFIGRLRTRHTMKIGGYLVQIQKMAMRPNGIP